MKVATLLNGKGDKVITIRPYAAIETAIRRMKLDAIGAMVVSLDGERILGIISERDITRGLADNGPRVLKMHVEDLMTGSVHTCTPQDTIRHVMAKMTRYRVRHLPVLEGHRLRGIVSIGDIVKNLLEEMELEVNVLRDAYIASR